MASDLNRVSGDAGFRLDDQPEMLKHIPAGVRVMLFRNEGNYDFKDRRWMFSGETGKQVC